MSESLAVSKLMQEAEAAIEVCPVCRERGHEMCCCPHLAGWLQLKFYQHPRPGIKPKTLWAGFWCCVVVVLVASGLWRWL